MSTSSEYMKDLFFFKQVIELPVSMFSKSLILIYITKIYKLVA
jgi:hypothetical protein